MGFLSFGVLEFSQGKNGIFGGLESTRMWHENEVGLGLGCGPKRCLNS